MKTWFDRTLLGLHMMGAAMLAALVGVICYDVGGRMLFNRPYAGTAELAGAGLVLLTFLQTPHVLREGKLLRVTFFLDLVPPLARRALEVLAWAIGAAVFAVFFAAGWEPALAGWASGEFYGNDAFRLPAWPLRFGALVLWFITAAACLGLVIEHLRGPAAPASPQDKT